MSADTVEAASRIGQYYVAAATNVGTLAEHQAFSSGEPVSFDAEDIRGDVERLQDRWNAIAAEAQAVPVDPAAEGGGAEAKGPIRDWFQENRDLVKLVVDRLLKLILGA